MSARQRPKFPIRWLKYLLLLTLAALFLLAALVAVSQTSLCKAWLRKKIVAAANARINGSLRIGRIEGNLLTHFQLREMEIAGADGAILSIPRLAVRFSPWRLLRNEVVLHVVAIDSPRVRLKQRPDSLWNALTLLKSDSTAPADADTADTWRWTFNLANMTVRNGDLEIRPLTPVPGLPGHFRNISARIGFLLSPDSIRFTIADLSLQTTEPAAAVAFTAEATYADSLLTLTRASIRLAGSALHLAGKIRLSVSPELQLEFNASPLELSALEPFLPDLPVQGKFAVSGRLRYRGRAGTLEAQISQDALRLQLAGRADFTAAQPAYAIEMKIADLSLADVLADTSLDHVLNGRVVLSGQGFDKESAGFAVDAALVQSRLFGRALDSARVRGEVRAGNARFEITGSAASGRIAAQGRIEELFHRQVFTGRASIAHADLSRLLPQQVVPTDLNVQIAVRGQHLHPDSLRAALQLAVAPSAVHGVRLDTLFCNARFADQRLVIDTLQARSQLGRFFLAGTFSLAAENNAHFRGQIGDLRWVQDQIEADTLRVQGEIAGKITGPAEALRSTIAFAFRNFSFNNVKIDTMRGKASLRLSADSLSGDIAALCRESRLAPLALDSLHLRSHFSRNKAAVDLAFSDSAGFSGNIRANLRADSSLTLTVPAVQIRYKNQLWRTTGRLATLRIQKSGYRLENLSLQNGAQEMTARGLFGADDSLDFSLNVRDLDLTEMCALLQLPPGIAGDFNFAAGVTGTARKPKLTARLTVRNGRFTEFQYDSLRIDFHYQDALLKWLFVLDRDAQRSLRGDGFLPIDLASGEHSGVIDRNKPFRFQVATQGIDLSFLQAFTTGLKKIAGTFNCDVQITNTLQAPQPVGHMSIFDGAFTIPAYGAKYKDMQVRLGISRDRVKVIEFDIGTAVKKIKRRRRKKNRTAKDAMRGRLWVEPQSYVAFDSSGFLSGVQSMDLTVRANEFSLASSSDIQAAIDAEIKITGEMQAPAFSGRVTVLRSSLYLPALEETGLYEEKVIGALLKQVRQDTTPVPETAAPGAASPYLRNLRGLLKIEIPKNAWIRSPEMNVEISGTLELVKDGPEFQQPFGEIQVIRGTYDLFNAYRFEITEGQLFFEGGEEFNPRIDVRARHILRNRDRTTTDLDLKLTGKMFAPDLQFSRDDEAIDVTEALALLVSGGASLSNGAASSGILAGSGTSPPNTQTRARDAITGLLTSQLASYLLKSQIPLDVLEVKGSLSNEEASIVLGKYITNRLFLSIEKSFNLGGEAGSASDQIAIEYALTRYLILQAIAGDERTTGFDLFWKFSK